MTKRSNPFLEDFIPQSKTHVGLKQFNKNQDRMQKVYEKTLYLLYKGAKKSHEEVTITCTQRVHLARKDCRKQLLINKDGSLVNNIITEWDKQYTVQVCVCGSMEVETECSYCEMSLCATCKNLCARCCLTFCSKCSLFGSEITVICVSCYG